MKTILLKLFTVLSIWLYCTNAFAQYKPGELDPTFRAPLINGTVLKTIQVFEQGVAKVVEDNGSMMIVGNFSRVGGKAYGGIAKLGPDGSLDETFGSDPTFNGAIGANDTIYDCAFFSNGNFPDTTYMIVVGKFAAFNGDKNARNIAIIDANGKIAVDMSKYQFNNTIYGIERYTNGQYYLYGKFGKPVVNGITSNSPCIVKLSNENAVFPGLPMDASFQAKGSSIAVNGPVYTVTSDYTNSQVYVGGRFSKPSRYIFRFNDSPGTGAMSFDNYFMFYSGMIPDSTVRVLSLHYPFDPQAGGQELVVAGDFKKWSNYSGIITATSGLVKTSIQTGGTINTGFKPVINTGTVNSISFDENDSLVVTGPTVINGKPVGQLQMINNITGASSTLFFPGNGFTSGNVFYSRYRNGGFFLSGSFTQYDGTLVSRVIKINQSIQAADYYLSNAEICEGDSIQITGTDLGTANSVKWGKLSLAFRVASNEMLNAFFPAGLISTKVISMGDSLSVTTIYPGHKTPPSLTVYRKPDAPTILTPVINRTQTIKLGESGKTVRFKVSAYNQKIYKLQYENLNNGYIYNNSDSVYVSYNYRWTGQDTARVFLTYNDAYSVSGSCNSKYAEQPVSVFASNKPALLISGRTKVIPGIIEKYRIIRRDTVSSNISKDITYDWFFISKKAPTTFTKKYLYGPVNTEPSDSASAQFSFLNNTPEGFIAVIAALEGSGESSYYSPFDTLYIPFRIVTSSVLPTTCVDTLGCNGGYNITQVKIEKFNFNQKLLGIDCLGDGYSDFSADSFTYVNTNGEPVRISMERQTLFTSGTLNIRVESDKPQYYGIWIDLNNNNDFNDPQEFRARSLDTSTSYFTSIIIPNFDQVVGERRLRIRASNYVLKTPCSLTNQNTNNDEKGETEDYVIVLAPYLNLQANQVITPNGDGNNEFLDIRGVDPLVEERKLIIYDRFGKKVYQNANYTSDAQWTGQDENGQPLENGTYYFYFKNGERSLKNFVEIFRDNN